MRPEQPRTTNETDEDFDEYNRIHNQNKDERLQSERQIKEQRANPTLKRVGEHALNATKATSAKKSGENVETEV